MPTTPAKSPDLLARVLRTPAVAPPGRLVDDARYRALRSEIDRAQEVTPEPTDWAQVEELGLALLSDGYDDLLVAAYTARGAQERDLLEGVDLGLALFTEFLGPRWTSVTPPPRRLRARTSALRWWVRAATDLLRDAPIRELDKLDKLDTPDGPDRLDRLDASLQQLGALARQRAGEDAPSLAALRRELRRRRPSAKPTTRPRSTVREGLIDQAERHPTSSSRPLQGAESEDRSAARALPETAGEPDSSASEQPDARRQAPAAAPAPKATSSAPEEGEPQRDLERQIRRLGERLIETGEHLRSIDPRDPRSYELLRHGLWLHLQALPPAVAGTTTIAETSPSAIRQLEALRGRARWEEVVDLAERLVIRHRLDLNLQRTTAEALRQLNPPAEEAAAAVRTRTLEYIARFPGALDLKSREGSPFADEDTRAWLCATPAPLSAAAPTPSGGPPTPPTSASQHTDSNLCAPQGSDASRFLHGLELAEAALLERRRPLASALFASLVETVEHHHLDRWRPDLAHRARAGALLSQATPLDPTSPEVRRLAAVAPDVVARIFANAR